MFDAAIAYFDNYRKRRFKALGNEEAQRWFTDDVDSLGALFSDPFAATEENTALAKLFAEKKVDALKLQAAQLKLDVVAGLRHDLRVQFAVGAASQPRTASDYDRHAVCEHAAARRRFDYLKQILGIKANGGTPA